jgi:hypothetical protein
MEGQLLIQVAAASGYDYRVEGVETVLTPALAIYPDIVRANVAATIRLLGGSTRSPGPRAPSRRRGWSFAGSTITTGICPRFRPPSARPSPIAATTG